MILLLAGLPGTGKSAIARAVAARSGGIVLSKDGIRAALFPPKHIEYSRAQDDFVMELMLAAAAHLVRRDPKLLVILDGRTFSRRYQVDAVIRWAGKHRQSWRIAECVCPTDLAIARIKKDRAAKKHPAKNRSANLYNEVQAQWQEVRRPKLVLDTAQSRAKCVAAVMHFLAST